MLWIPGPTYVRPEVLAEQEAPLIGHRSAAMVDLIASLDPGLRLAFGLRDGSGSQVAVGTHSATAMMEGSLHGVGPRILVCVNGAFSERWGEIARLLGKDVVVLEFEWGRVVDPTCLAETLTSAGPFDAVTLVVNETSTGVRTPHDSIAPVLEQHPDTLLLVDVVSSIAGYAIDFDANGVDFALAGINKALALPPGLCVFAASERYLESARARERACWYIDPVRTLDGHVARKTPATPAITLYRALARQLADIGAGWLEGGDFATAAAAWNARFERHERMRERALEWARSHGIEPFPEEAGWSPTVSCFRAGDLDVPSLSAGLAARGETVGGGYGPLKTETFRIGHMGDHTEAGLETLLVAFDEVVRLQRATGR